MRATIGDVTSAVRTAGSGALLAISLGWLLSLGTRLAIPVLLPRLGTAFGFGLATGGALMTTLWLVYAAMQFPGGLLTDRFDERTVVVASMTVATAGLGLIGSAVGVSMLALGIVVFAAGTGLFGTARLTTLAALFPDRQGSAFGFSSAFGNVGTAALPAVVGLVAAAYGWRAALVGSVPLYLCTVVWLGHAVPSSSIEREAPSTSGIRSLLWRAIGRRTTVLAAFAMFLMMVVYQSFTSFYPLYLHLEAGLSTETASLLFGAFFAAGSVVQPVAGYLGDRLRPRLVLVGVAGWTAVSLVALPSLRGFDQVLAFTLLASIQLGFWPIAQSYLVETIPVSVRGSGYGLVRSLYLLLASAGPAVVGVLAGRNRFGAAFVLLGGFAAAAAVTWLCLATVD